jgi:hypothetical protein
MKKRHRGDLVLLSSSDVSRYMAYDDTRIFDALSQLQSSCDRLFDVTSLLFIPLFNYAMNAHRRLIIVVELNEKRKIKNKKRTKKVGREKKESVYMSNRCDGAFICLC